MALTRDGIAKRIAQEFRDGYYVNLGKGMPTLAVNYLPKNMIAIIQSENGLLGLGPHPTESEVDPDCINASKETTTAIPGAVYVASDDSFAMIRGGHIDLSILGAMEVDEEGTLANWMVPGQLIKGMGGAMDLVHGAKKVIVAMQHTSKDGKTKVLRRCTLPLTGQRCVTRIITDLAVMDVIPEKGLQLMERAPGVSIEEIRAATQATLIISSHVPEMNL